MKKIIFRLFLIIYSCHVYPYSTLWDFDPQVIDAGLNDHAVYHLCSDDKGFIWGATDRGISRYDGFRFRNYPLVMSCDSAATPLPQAVKDIKRAPGRFFYVCMHQGGMMAFDTEKEIYLPIRYDHSFRMRDILDFYVDSTTVYLCTAEGLCKSTMQRVCEKGKEYINCTLEKRKLVDGSITSICGNGSDLYMIVNGRKVVNYNTESKKTTLIKESDKLNRLFYKKGNLWMGLLDRGIVYFDLKKQTERLFTLNSNYLNSVYISSITPMDDQNYYLTTWSGLFCLKFDSPDLLNSAYLLEAVSPAGDSRSKIENKMTSLLWDDDQKIFWIGTFGGGILKMVANEDGCSRVEQRLDERTCGMAEDEKGYVWLITTSGNVMKSTSSSFSVKSTFALWKKIGELGEQYCMYKDKNGRLWIGSGHGDILFINPLTEESAVFSLKRNGKKLQTVISECCLDSRNRLWVGTDDGLFQIDPLTSDCKQVSPKNKKWTEKVYAVAEDKEGNIWIGTKKGLKRIEIMNDEVNLIGGYELCSGLEESPVMEVYVNNYNQIYVAYLNAVIRIDGRHKDEVEAVYTLLNGLTTGHVHCMIDDLNGNTWAGNNVGLTTIRNGQTAFYNYVSVGNCSSVCRLNDGRLLWANSWDLLFIDPQLIKMKTQKVRLYLTHVEVGGKTIQSGESRNGQVILTSSPEKQDKFEFTTDNNDFCLFFSDLRYGVVKRKIAYRLLPAEQEWSMKQLAEGVSFNRLPVGEYVLEAKLVYPDGSEGELLQVPIRIKPDWYATIWAYCSYGLLLMLTGFFIHRIKMKKDVKKRVRTDREMCLKEALHTERMKREQKREIDVIRNQLLMLFVQEMRTPLSLIIAPLKDLLEENSSFEAKGRVAYRNALRMLNACDQLIGLYGEDLLEDKLKIAPYSAEGLIDNVLLDIRELLKVYAIDFQYEKRIKKDMEFYVDKKKIELVIRNLLSNAFTHTHYAGRVLVTLCETVEDGKTFFSIIVEDDGKVEMHTPDDSSLSDDKVLSKEVSSVELGYDMMELIVEMHHGRILLQTSGEEGTKVTINLPIDKTCYEMDENVEFVTSETLSEQSLKLPPKTGAGVERHVQLPPNVELLVAEEITSAQNVKRKYSLLIIEDQKDIRLYLKVLLGKEYNLLMAINGQEGVELARKELPDLIICDVMMPVKDGFECCKDLKEDVGTCNIPFIMLTAKVEDEDIIRGLELGADDYMLKPFTPSILKVKIQNLIEGRRSLKLMYTKLLKLPGVDMIENEVEAKQEEEQEDSFVSEVIKIIEENIGEPDFSVKKLASDLNMSQPTLYRKVKQSTDCTIIELIRGVRMRRAAVLLKMKQYGVQEVSEMVGYNDIPTFRKHFVDAFGTTPSTYE